MASTSAGAPHLFRFIGCFLLRVPLRLARLRGVFRLELPAIPGKARKPPQARAGPGNHEADGIGLEREAKGVHRISLS